MPVDHETLLRAAEHAGLELDEGSVEALAHDLSGVLRWAGGMPAEEEPADLEHAATEPVDGK